MRMQQCDKKTLEFKYEFSFISSVIAFIFSAEYISGGSLRSIIKDMVSHPNYVLVKLQANFWAQKFVHLAEFKLQGEFERTVLG